MRRIFAIAGVFAMAALATPSSAEAQWFNTWCSGPASCFTTQSTTQTPQTNHLGPLGSLINQIRNPNNLPWNPTLTPNRPVYQPPARPCRTGILRRNCGPVSVPEPSTFLLVASGIGLIWLRGRKDLELETED